MKKKRKNRQRATREFPKSCCICQGSPVTLTSFGSENFEVSVILCRPCNENIRANQEQIEDIGKMLPISVVLYLLAGQLEVVTNLEQTPLTTEPSRPGTHLH